LYTVEFEASNDDSYDVISKRVYIAGAEEDTVIVTSTSSKTFAVGEDKTYSLTVVNKGRTVRIYELDVTSDSELTVDISDTLVVVPAGSSRTVTFNVIASEDGRHTFNVNVNSDNGELIDGKTFTANVEGKASAIGTGNTTVLLTVVLAIVFIVLLIVLIVLLTRKPSQEEVGESYY
ncbi:hypothetical protein DRJ16_04680, partial [Candidatus Woesearchaeota archaeon]